MKIENYNKFTALLSRKTELEEQLKTIDAKYRGQGDKIIDIGWLQLTFGNGSNRQTILNNPDHMNQVAKLIKELINKELKDVLVKMNKI